MSDNSFISGEIVFISLRKITKRENKAQCTFREHKEFEFAVDIIINFSVLKFNKWYELQ